MTWCIVEVRGHGGHMIWYTCGGQRTWGHMTWYTCGGQRTWEACDIVHMWRSEDIGGTCHGAYVEVRGHGPNIHGLELTGFM